MPKLMNLYTLFQELISKSGTWQASWKVTGKRNYYQEIREGEKSKRRSKISARFPANYCQGLLLPKSGAKRDISGISSPMAYPKNPLQLHLRPSSIHDPVQSDPSPNSQIHESSLCNPQLNFEDLKEGFPVAHELYSQLQKSLDEALAFDSPQILASKKFQNMGAESVLTTTSDYLKASSEQYSFTGRIGIDPPEFLSPLSTSHISPSMARALISPANSVPSAATPARSDSKFLVGDGSPKDSFGIKSEYGALGYDPRKLENISMTSPLCQIKMNGPAPLYAESTIMVVMDEKVAIPVSDKSNQDPLLESVKDLVSQEKTGMGIVHHSESCLFKEEQDQKEYDAIPTKDMDNTNDDDTNAISGASMKSKAITDEHRFIAVLPNFALGAELEDFHFDDGRFGVINSITGSKDSFGAISSQKNDNTAPLKVKSALPGLFETGSDGKIIGFNSRGGLRNKIPIEGVAWDYPPRKSSTIGPQPLKQRKKNGPFPTDEQFVEKTNTSPKVGKPSISIPVDHSRNRDLHGISEPKNTHTSADNQSTKAIPDTNFDVCSILLMLKRDSRDPSAK
eukprot:TRINITY_DN4988_c0_g1_i3.p1 TRINITY_DN4988_c0_g1~~TRINITY_DN4988_c0_g1_i3.p1  ORF type:complete len:567 (+),score=75.56 TRINITY_DN4988_c0_g1_i3:543-2243(+)